MKKILLVCLFVVVLFFVNVDWNVGLFYINLFDSDDGMDMLLGGIVGYVSYDYVILDKFILVLEFCFGVGVIDDEMVVFVIFVEVEFDLFFVFLVRV